MTRKLNKEMVSQFIAKNKSTQFIYIGLIFMLILHGVSIGFQFLNNSFNPDESLVVNLVREVGFGEFRDRYPTHFGAIVQFYYLGYFPGFDVKTLQFFAALFLALNAIYSIWVIRSYRLLEPFYMFLYIGVLSLSDPNHHYGTWGLFQYSQAILASTVILHILLFLSRLSFNYPSIWYQIIVCCLPVLLIVNFGPNLLAAVVMAGASFLSVGFKFRGEPTEVRKLFVRALPLFISIMIGGIVTLKWLAHAEFREPREVIRWLYFPYSDYTQNIPGAVEYLKDHSINLIQTIWRPNRLLANEFPIFKSSIVTGILFTLFALGLAGSLRKTAELRLPVALYLLGSYGTMAAAGLHGSYAFGEVRYSLLLLIPTYVITAQGARDVCAFCALRIKSLGLPLVRSGMYVRSIFAIVVGLLLIFLLSITTRNISRETFRFNSEFDSTVQELSEISESLVIWDAYTGQTLEYMNVIPNDSKSFFLDRAFLRAPENSVVNLDQLELLVRQSPTIVTVTYWPLSHSAYEKIRLNLGKNHILTSSYGVNRLRVSRWTNHSE
ncbi:hypothetical protein N9023_04195 [Opitutaceae bacterium]|nr:hypothetical protein [Opitutaceae bacterium]MDB4474185.1 hypothetical protein [Opitutaceae bacterium]